MLALFAAADFLTSIGFVLARYDLLPWQANAWLALFIAGKALLFNDKFLSVIDLAASAYLVVAVFKPSALSWVFAAYFLYKAALSLL